MAELNEDYYCFTFDAGMHDIAYAQLYELGFDAFHEEEDCIDGYLPVSLWKDGIEVKIQSVYPYTSFKIVKQQNWNAQWESTFSPITIDDQIYVRATFHKPMSDMMEVVIDPKMAFGTGHHATTHMILSAMLEIDFKGKRVLDFGCGSGILAIAAEKLGASDIDAIDYDSWCVENTEENRMLNNCSRIKVWQEDHLKNLNEKYDVILANITRDVLLQNNHDIYRLLAQGGIGMYSGFIASDLGQILNAVKGLGVKEIKVKEMGDWNAIVWHK